VLANQRSTSGVKGGSGIRAMFELGTQYRKEGKQPIDLSIGNPDIRPPEIYYSTLSDIIASRHSSSDNMHKYMPNAGYLDTREVVARDLEPRLGSSFSAADIVMTAGAANALDVSLMTIIEPGVQDEVIVVAPCFVEYQNYIENNRGRQVLVHASIDFDLDLDALESAITSRTRALIINSPNNPTGRIYSEETLRALGDLLDRKNQEYGIEIIVLEDAPYDRLVFGSVRYESLMMWYRGTIYLTSFSKSLGLAGERIGYLAMHPQIGQDDETRQIFRAALGTNLRTRVVNAPGLQQKVIAKIGLNQSIPVGEYESRVNRLADTLESLGFPLVRPQGAFYLFPQLPDRFASEEAFRALAHSGEDPLLYTPGRFFGGMEYDRYIRLAACASSADVERGCEKLKRIANAP